MVTLHTSRGFVPFQVEIPSGLARSAPGSIHIRPDSTLVVTPDEHKWLQQNHGWAFRVVNNPGVRVIVGTTPSKAARTEPVVADPVVVEPDPHGDVTDSVPAPTKKKSKQSSS